MNSSKWRRAIWGKRVIIELGLSSFTTWRSDWSNGWEIPFPTECLYKGRQRKRGPKPRKWEPSLCFRLLMILKPPLLFLDFNLLPSSTMFPVSIPLFLIEFPATAVAQCRYNILLSFTFCSNRSIVRLLFWGSFVF